MTEILVLAASRAQAQAARAEGAGPLGLEAALAAIAGPADYLLSGPEAQLAVIAATGVDLAELKPKGFAGILLNPEPRERLLSLVTVAELARLIGDCRRHGLISAIAGLFEPPDLPRILALQPDLIAVPLAGLKTLRAMIRAHAGAGAAQSAIPDKLFIADLILPVAVGAYASERNRTQRVRFSVSAEIARRSAAPKVMADVFSYDIILDAIHAVVAQGHIDLLETLAEEIAQRLLQQPEIIRTTLKLEKLDLGPAVAGIEITRARR